MLRGPVRQYNRLHDSAGSGREDSMGSERHFEEKLGIMNHFIERHLDHAPCGYDIYAQRHRTYDRLLATVESNP